jgi:hypothetical protein
MANGEGMPHITKRNGDDLEPYRRLVELQKQLIEMARQYEQARHENATLREQVAREALASLRWKGRLRLRVRRSASRLFRRLPRLLSGGSETSFRPLNRKQPFSC